MSDPEVALEVLSKLQEDDLFALSRTVTQGLLKVSSKEDALRAIVKHSPDAVSILRRKLVTREVLFGYLDDKGIKIRLPATKNDIIDRILEYWKASSVANELAGEAPSGDLDALAVQFTGWFYSMLNTEGVGSEHFYSDVKLKVNLMSDKDCDTTYVEDDPDAVTRTLSRLRTDYGLTFNPNVTEEGVRGRIDPHGLVVVVVCGTLHVHDACAGVFEQSFGLVRDPSCDNNWKIKSSEINLRSKCDVVAQPRLCDGELTKRLAITE